MSTPFYKHVLRQELERRVGANPRYSLRAFARALAVDPSVLSRVLADKRTLSPRIAKRVVDQLSLPPNERAVFLESLVLDQKRQALVRALAPGPLVEDQPAANVGEVDAEVFRVIADLHHYAILELTRTSDFDAEPRRVARRLGISVLEAKVAIDRLVRLGLLERGVGTLRKTSEKITTKDKTLTTPALRRHQRQILERAAVSLENDPLEARSMSGMTMAIDPSKLPLARAMVQEFMESVCQVLSNGRKTRVYQLGVSLYPLDRGTTGDAK